MYVLETLMHFAIILKAKIKIKTFFKLPPLAEKGIFYGLGISKHFFHADFVH